MMKGSGSESVYLTKGSRSGSREAQKHSDPTDPNSQHWCPDPYTKRIRSGDLTTSSSVFRTRWEGPARVRLLSGAQLAGEGHHRRPGTALRRCHRQANPRKQCSISVTFLFGSGSESCSFWQWLSYLLGYTCRKTPIDPGRVSRGVSWSML
jgi:hypothetical protein